MSIIVKDGLFLIILLYFMRLALGLISLDSSGLVLMCFQALRECSSLAKHIQIDTLRTYVQIANAYMSW